MRLDGTFDAGDRVVFLLHGSRCSGIVYSDTRLGGLVVSYLVAVDGSGALATIPSTLVFLAR